MDWSGGTISVDPMQSDDASRRRLDTQALVVGYTMSRLDTVYLARRGLKSWRAAFLEAEKALGVPWANFKNLRDEFDPLHPNARVGWHDRPIRDSRQRVVDELADLGEDALLEMVERILVRQTQELEEAIDSLSLPSKIAHNVAERLLTGRRAEEFFQQYSSEIVGIPTQSLLDRRNAAIGYDFGVIDRDDLAIEVKGLKAPAGVVLFTDREWSEAKFRADSYWLVVIGNMAVHPTASVFRDPCLSLGGRCRYEARLTAQWQSKVSVADGIQLGG